jgi:hypothetical protein
MDTQQVKVALRRFYKKEEYALMWEVGNATGSRVRRHADAVVMNLWPSRGLLIEGIEIKVSRSDWRRELDNPEKAEEIARYCDRWWVVTPDGIVQPHELPAMWGHKVVNDKGAIRTVKDAPRNDNVAALDRGFVAAMLRRSSEADAREVEALVARQLAAERAKIEEEVERRVAARTKLLEGYRTKIEELKEAGIDLSHAFSENASDIISSYRLGRSLRSTYSLSGLSSTAKRLEEAAKLIHGVDKMLSAEAFSAS